MSVDEFTHSSIDEAALEAWLAEVFEVPAEPPAMRVLVGNVRETLVPIEPSPDFVRNLGCALAQTASQRQQPLRRRYRRAVWFGLAAAGSVASIVGVTAYMVHQRDRQHA
jgi:hypothetical protein